MRILCSGSRMMKNILTLTFLTSASAVFGQSSPKMSYDMIRVGYSQSEEIKGWGVNASALLGDSLIVSGVYQDLTARNLDDVDGKATGFGLGYRFGVGSGDIILNASYSQLQGSGFDGGAAVGIAADFTSYGISYRHSFSQEIEAFISYNRQRLEYGAGAIDLATGTAVGVGDTISDDVFAVALRYNFSKQFDVTAGYSWVDGDGAWAVSAGYNF